MAAVTAQSMSMAQLVRPRDLGHMPASRLAILGRYSSNRNVPDLATNTAGTHTGRGARRLEGLAAWLHSVQRAWRSRRAVRRVDACNILLCSLVVFFLYVFIWAWVDAITHTDYRAVGFVSVLFIGTMICTCGYRRRLQLLDRTEQERLEIQLNNAFQMIQEDRHKAGVPHIIRDTFDTFSHPGPDRRASMAPAAENGSCPVGGALSAVAEDAPEEKSDRGPELCRAASWLGTQYMSDDAECPVCLDRYAEGDRCCRLPCGHGFHQECIYRWLEDRHVCPFCKFDLLASSEGQGVDLEMGVRGSRPGTPYPHDSAPGF